MAYLDGMGLRAMATQVFLASRSCGGTRQAGKMLEDISRATASRHLAVRGGCGGDRKDSSHQLQVFLPTTS